MTKVEELRRVALLHRQAAFLLRRDAERHEMAAGAIDRDLAEAEKWNVGAISEINRLKLELASLGV